MSGNLIYRRATSDDALCLSVLATQVFLDTYATNGINLDLAKEVSAVLSRASFLARLESANVELFVAEQGGYLVGFLDLNLNSQCLDSTVTGMEILRVYVQQAFQRRNVGRTFMALAEERCRAAGHETLWLTAWVGNIAARAFYQTLGYQDVGVTQYLIEGQPYENKVLAKRVHQSS
jgi:ribosomal protein S18 acetylase RimI-like enzyme